MATFKTSTVDFTFGYRAPATICVASVTSSTLAKLSPSTLVLSQVGLVPVTFLL